MANNPQGPDWWRAADGDWYASDQWDVSRGPGPSTTAVALGWWKADDGTWYSPEQWTGPADLAPAVLASSDLGAAAVPAANPWLPAPIPTPALVPTPAQVPPPVQVPPASLEMVPAVSASALDIVLHEPTQSVPSAFGSISTAPLPAQMPAMQVASGPFTGPRYPTGAWGRSTILRFDGGAATYFGTAILATLVTVCTLGICFPFALVLFQRWRAKHTLILGHRLIFTGMATHLFGLWLKWLFLIIITLGIYSFWVTPRIFKWVAEHTDIDPDAPIEALT